MEGEICNLPEFVEIKRKYKAYLYVDEAHSIGAIGQTGRGVCDYCGVDPSNVDILMGTFTKSFGSCGGYVAGSRAFIKYLRHTAYGSLYAETMSPAAVQQALTALQTINGERGGDEGKKRILQLRDNSIFFRTQLKEMGFHVIGNLDSPVIPMIVYNPAKITAFSRECLERGLAIVAVGFPATPLISARARFCLSASHTRKDLENALRTISELGDLLLLKYKRSWIG
jgi:serine palmitoyltransferase